MDKLAKYRQGTPPYFYVVIRLSHNLKDTSLHETIAQLKQHKLEGLTGISDNRAIIFNFFGIAREAFVVMDGNAVVNQNDLRQITYEPEDLVANNMSDLSRIFAGKDVAGIIQTLGDYILPIWKKMGLRDSLDAAQYFGLFGSRLSYIDPDRQINTVSDLANWLQYATLNKVRDVTESDYYKDIFQKVTPAEWEKSVYLALKRVEEIYGDEGEWEVPNDSLEIPNNSRLYVSWPAFMYEDEILEFVKRYQRNELTEQEIGMLEFSSHGKRSESLELTKYRDYITEELGDSYRIFFLPYNKFEQARLRYINTPKKTSKIRLANNFDGTHTVYDRDTSIIINSTNDLETLHKVYCTLYKRWELLQAELAQINISKKQALYKQDKVTYAHIDKSSIPLQDQLYAIEVSINELKNKLSNSEAKTITIKHEKSQEDYGLSKILDNINAKQYNTAETIFNSMFEDRKVLNRDISAYEDPGIVATLPVITFNTGSGVKESLTTGANASRIPNFKPSSPFGYVTIYKVSNKYNPAKKAYIETKRVVKDMTYAAYNEKELEDIFDRVSSSLNYNDPEDYLEAYKEVSIGQHSI